MNTAVYKRVVFYYLEDQVAPRVFKEREGSNIMKFSFSTVYEKDMMKKKFVSCNDYDFAEIILSNTQWKDEYTIDMLSHSIKRKKIIVLKEIKEEISREEKIKSRKILWEFHVHIRWSKMARKNINN